MNDPLERKVARALERAGIAYEHEPAPARLDFYLPEHDVWIECKRFHSPRIGDQTSRAENVIVLQGAKSVAWLVRLLTGEGS